MRISAGNSLGKIVYEKGDYWAIETNYGFCIFRAGITHSAQCAIIGFAGAEGMRRVKAEINRRIALHSANIGARKT